VLEHLPQNVCFYDHMSLMDNNKLNKAQVGEHSFGATLQTSGCKLNGYTTKLAQVIRLQ
jgi:hypothetical protein